MARSASFRPGREPFAQDDRFTPSKVHGPFSVLNPTRALFDIDPGKKTQEQPSQDESGDIDGKEGPKTVPNVKFLWRSRDNRKGRHPLVVDKSSADGTTPQSTARSSEIIKTTFKIFTYYPVWDISWLVAYIFTWGSIVWVINGFFSFLPYIHPSWLSDHDVLYGGGITAFIGAVVFFETGSILLMFEAVNENRAGCFGWAIERLIEDGDGGSQLRITAAKEECNHHHKNKKNFVGSSGKGTADLREDGKTWQWFPTWLALRTHYLRELGFIASLSQFCGATIFSIAGFTALPGINNKMSQPLLDGIFWAPQIIGGSGFIISGTLYMLETQKSWYIPSYGVLGWHIAFWNLIGGIGFTLCGILGPIIGNERAQWHSACATFWGSWCFLIGSVLQLYESLQKNPVEVVKRKEK